MVLLFMFYFVCFISFFASYILDLVQKNKCESAVKKKCDIRNMVEWGVPLSSLFQSTSPTTITYQRIPSLTHKQFWEICPWKHMKVGKSWMNMEGGKKSKTGVLGAPQSSLQGSVRGKESGCCMHLCSTEHSCLNNQHILWLNPAISGAETRIQKCDSCALAAATARQNTKPRSLATSPNPPIASNRPQKVM